MRRKTATERGGIRLWLQAGIRQEELSWVIQALGLGHDSGFEYDKDIYPSRASGAVKIDEYVYTNI
jgi:hypothetical protein